MTGRMIVWDYNGTILDDTEICLEIENRMLRERGLPNPVAFEDYRRNFGFPVINYYYRIGYTFETETYEEVSDEFNLLYEQEFPRMKLAEGFLPFIDDACAKGYEHVIVSASRQDKLERQCEALGISSYFTELIGIDDHLAGSKIDKALAWQQRTGYDPKDMIYIGDTVHDLETAAALGITNYWLIACGHQAEEVLRRETDRVVTSFKDIKI